MHNGGCRNLIMNQSVFHGLLLIVVIFPAGCSGIFRYKNVICYEGSWLLQLEAYLKDIGVTGPASARAIARQRPNE